MSISKKNHVDSLIMIGEIEQSTLPIKLHQNSKHYMGGIVEGNFKQKVGSTRSKP
jgi:hypothetical protein